MRFLRVLLGGILIGGLGAQASGAEPKLMRLGLAWAANSVNTAIFRNDPICTHNDRQYAAYYNADGQVVIATRKIGDDQWQLKTTDLTGNIKDAHNVISMIADGDGFLHISWDHHNHPLRYVRSKEPGSLSFAEKIQMTGKNEASVSYPQFYRLADGSLMFLYRDGASGRGNLAVNHYDLKKRAWTQMHANLISGEGRRNAYWQACVDGRGSIHVSWVWRESPDVATNHDLCYAVSNDGGKTWRKSDGTAYALPITAATAEIAAKIPQKRELINQTAMCTDGAGRPIIATYFRPEDEQVVQYVVIYQDEKGWKSVQASNRSRAFSLSGAGSKQIPISRPQVFARTTDGKTAVWVIFRDAERNNFVSVAQCPDLSKPKWLVKDLTDFSVRYWEPTYDRTRWQRDGVLDLFVQLTGQGDAEGLEDVPAQIAQVLEWKP